eukprot:TRINITY_DN10236_c0_g1_i1.p1 TRINITY_DN10236_c0_g1~~TRINITY_DN10236_c0_g1_i1.p1  ORF type:complete len:143 (+),score=42.27 TRINITY_DN10236_c0_g1_i1:164-592(+)
MLNFILSSFVLLVLFQQINSERLVAAGSLTECKAAGDKRVCDGAVTKELKSTVPSVQVCDMGKLKVKGAKQVGDGAPTSGGECEWYGQLYCDGDIIIDLYTWKFLKKCQDGKMGIYGRTWQEVSSDPRFKNEAKKIAEKMRR